MDIDKKTAILIADTYNQIHDFKVLLNDDYNAQIRHFLESGNQMSQIMNRIFVGDDPSTFKEISTLLSFIDETKKTGIELRSKGVQIGDDVFLRLQNIHTSLSEIKSKSSKYL